MEARELTPKQELFCQRYIETGNASEAYRQAYQSKNMQPTTVCRNAHALLQDNKISTRIALLRSEHSRRHHVTIASLTAQLEEALQVAHKIGAPTAMVSAIMGMAKLHGFLNNRLELLTSPEPEIDKKEVARRAAFLLSIGLQ